MASSSPGSRPPRSSACKRPASHTSRLDQDGDGDGDSDGYGYGYGQTLYRDDDDDDDDDDDSADEYTPQLGGNSSKAAARPPPKPSARRTVAKDPRPASDDDSSDSDLDSDSELDSDSDSFENGSEDDGDNDDDNGQEANSGARHSQAAFGIDPALIGASGSASSSKGRADDEDIDFESESFNRLVSSLQDTSRQAGALRKTWDTSIEQETLEFEAELRATAGFHKRRRVRRTFKEQNLSLEVRQLLSDANLLFVEQRLEEAIPKLTEVIRIEPTALTAWRTLGLIYEELGQEERSIQCRIVGAHLQPRAMDEWKRLAYRSVDKGLYNQAIFCLSQAIRLDRTDVDSIWDRALMLRDLGQHKTAINGFLDLLKLQPHDASVVRELVPMLVTDKDFERAIGVLDEWLQHSMAAHPDPTTIDDDPDAPVNSFGVSELVTLADLLLEVRRPAETIAMIRLTARWLDGRASETFWDAVSDDREFDEDRDDAIAHSRQQGGYGRMVEMAPPHVLDPEIRLRLGKARMMIKDIAEAKRHFELLTDTDPAEATLIFGEVGDCFFEHKMWAEALDVLSDLASVDWVGDVSLYAKMAVCNHALGDLKEAARLYEPVVESRPDNLEWQMGLAEVYEEMGDKDRSLEVLRNVVRVLQAQKEAEAADRQARELNLDQDGDASMAAKAGLVGDTQMSFFDELSSQVKQRSMGKRARMNYDREQRLKIEEQREQDTLLCWRRLELLQGHVFVEGFWRADVPLTKSGEEPAGLYGSHESSAERNARYRCTRQWLEEAGSLIESFRTTKKLHPGKKRNHRLYHARQRALRPTAGGGLGGISSQAQSLLYRLQDSMIEEDLDAEHADIPGMEVSFRRSLDQERFRGIAIDDWIDLFARYAMALTKIGEDQEMVNELFNILLTCNVVWGNHRRMMTVRLAWLSCAMYARDHDAAFRCLRWLCQEHQFHDQPLRLLVSVTNALGLQSLNRFVASRDAKFYQRRMRYIEAIVAGLPCYFSDKTHHFIIPSKIFLDATYSVGDGPAGGRAGTEAGEDDGEADEENEVGDHDDEDEEDDTEEEEAANARFSQACGDPADGGDSTTAVAAAVPVPKGSEPDRATAIRLAKPSKPSPIAEAAYGYMLLASGGYQAPGAFFARAFAIQQNDPLICLCAAVAFAGRATNRQADNRHHMVLQAMTFLQLYKRNLGLTFDDATCQEVEYNYGRLLHHLGLLHLAVPHYERVLSFASTPDAVRLASTGGGGGKKMVGFKMQREAAFNLSLIYTLNGSPHLARRLYRKWLVVA